MLYLKKYFTEGLIQFTILLSLIGVRVDVDTYLSIQLPPLREIILGPSSAYTPTQFHNLRNTLDGYGIHPKSVDLDRFFATRRLLNQVRQLDRLSVPTPELDTWLVHRDAESVVSAGGQPGSAGIALDNGGGLEDVDELDAAPAMRGGGGAPESTYDVNAAGAVAPDGGHEREDRDAASDLSKEDIDLIDILWRQDIDLGAGREVFNYSSRQREENEEDKPRPQESKDAEEEQESWRNGVNLRGLHGCVDGETGESIPQQPPAPGSQTSLSLQECLRLLEATFPFGEDPEVAPPSATDVPSTSQGLSLAPAEPQLDLEQQWQDIMAVMELQAMEVSGGNTGCSANVGRTAAPNAVSDFGPAPPSAPITQDVSLHQASLADCSPEFPPVFQPHLEATSFPARSAVRASSSNSSNINATFGTTNLTGLFLPPLLNATGANMSAAAILPDPFGSLLEESMLDEISLLDLAMEEGFSQAQASQLQDELDSDSGLSLDSSRSPASPSSSETSSSTSATFSEEGAVGYSTDSEVTAADSEEGAVGGYQPEYSKLCRMSFQDPAHFRSLPQLGGVNHNHTYNLPLAFAEHPELPVEPGKKAGRDKQHSKLQPPRDLLDKHSSRDERRARAMKIPFSNDKIVNLPVEEFNELLAKHHLSEAQLALIRDIRRRGKNKMAAQNCRKRKLDTIINLEQGVHDLRRDKARLLKEKMEFIRCIRQMKQKMQSLCQEVFTQLRDEQGRPYPPSQYSLQYGADGSVLVVPRRPASAEPNRRTDKKPKEKKK
ncbi:endoplasmic reticulum membrane sensor NFE2L1b isoform X2 [Dunckerocampus dactyliophorus]|uniref:endoplasmic reticulum membrane sensor NFE2L1b isoform X2 n=1 Tax=Dunckerocampus dactyliophorus TaxID=161453 RepID=UPI002406406E|nr:endoplasmic reticulum membrane sensor NFE2L1b isoform X2 [Dunckerocampus dactyliophorus]